MVTFSERLKELRTEKGLSLRELAKLAKINHSTISSYEMGRRTPRYECLSALAKVFDCDIEYLLGHTNIKRGAKQFDLQLFAENKSPSNESDLTEGEMELIKLFRLLPVEEQNLYLEMFRARLNARTKGQ